MKSPNAVQFEVRMPRKRIELKDFSPSKMMRARRPELYSDSQTIGSYKLSRSAFAHHLATLTERNEHKPFEDFCRALAQREICRNLRPQTGPEGGGDGKVDTETYPVSEEISDRWFEGISNRDGERWAFAFSAKKTWATKVRSDVTNIAGTGRPYKHIHFFTNQNPKSKKRLEVEDELFKQYGIPVTIYDRNWIEEKVIKNRHADLAHDILGVGDFDPSFQKKRGAKDTYRENELDEIEAAFADPTKSRLSDIESVSEALNAAKLSRGLERPKIETDGRFERAITLAEKFGTRRHQFTARYEKAWTAIFWFDDFDTANSIYDELENRAAQDGDCNELERLGNLLNVFIGHERAESKADYRITERATKLRARLALHAADNQRPNHALYADTLLAFHDLMILMRDWRSNEFDGIWIRLIAIIERAKGLGEFPAELVAKMTRVFSELTPDSEKFDELVIKIADFMGERAREGEQGELLMRHGVHKLENDKPIDAIVWLSKAAIAFNKDEYREKRVEAQYYSAVAYRSAGLYWAARASALSCLVSISIIADSEGYIPDQYIPATKLYCLICMHLGRLPDVLQSLFLLRLLQNNISLSDEARKHLEDNFVELDRFLACCFAKFDASELGSMSNVPDLLDGIDLAVARLTLLYRIGHLEALRKEGTVPPELSDDDIAETINLLAGQPAAREFPTKALLNEGGAVTYKTKVLGVKLSLHSNLTEHEIAACELLMASIEAFVATMLNRGVFPQTPEVIVIVKFVDDSEEIAINVDIKSMQFEILWPKTLDPIDMQKVEKVQRGIIEVIGKLTGLIFIFEDVRKLLESLFKDESVFARSMLFSNTAISHQRVFGSTVAQISDIPIPIVKSFRMLPSAPVIVPIIVKGEPEESEPRAPEMKSHANISVETIINTHLWNEAKWRATLYVTFEGPHPPIIGLLFENSKAAEDIFSQLIDKIGDRDEDELIRVGIVKGVDSKNPYHYVVHIAQSRDSLRDAIEPGSIFVGLSRINIMTAASHKNLDRFLKDYARYKAFYLMPAENTAKGPAPISNLRIRKTKLIVVDAWEVDDQHEDAIAIRHPEEAIVPSGIENPPIKKLIEMRKKHEFDD